jgi:hypothetical protein
MHLTAAVKAFFRVLSQGETPAPPAALAPAAPPAPAFKPSPEQAVLLLALFQKEGRLVDFLREDIAHLSDADIGAAVREVHRGCRRVLDAYFDLAPVVDAPEGATTTVPAGFDASRIAIEGAITGAGPWQGIVLHRGCRADAVRMPTIAPGADPMVIAPAQVQLR